MKKLAAMRVALLLLALMPSCTKQPAAGERPETAATAHAWKVFDGEVLILDVSDTPGPILSTAALPPGAAPARHPFLSASARSARHEHKLRERLNEAKSLPEFLSLLRAAGYKVVPDAGSAPPALPVPSTAPSSSAAPGPAAEVASDLVFQVVENIEMVPYCLPYPSGYMKADESERWEHGRRVFTSRATPKGAKPARLDFSGTCGPRTLKELFEADRKNIEGQVSAAAITVSKLQQDSYALSWRAGDRIHYGKMWTAKGDPGCFVRATFEYDVRERPAFDAIIAKVTTADPACAAK